jgi:predicted nuclease of restriction endonuclease-like (RecB) superfamily
MMKKHLKWYFLFFVNEQLLILYWNIGNIILKYQDKSGWGAKIIDNIAKEIKLEFPDLRGFSPRNLKYMRKFSLEYKNLEFVQQVVAQIPWSQEKIPEELKGTLPTIQEIEDTLE